MNLLEKGYNSRSSSKVQGLWLEQVWQQNGANSKKQVKSTAFAFACGFSVSIFLAPNLCEPAGAQARKTCLCLAQPDLSFLASIIIVEGRRTMPSPQSIVVAIIAISTKTCHRSFNASNVDGESVSPPPWRLVRDPSTRPRSFKV